MSDRIKKAFQEFIKNNEEALRSEYLKHRLAHGFCKDGTRHKHFHSFQEYATRQYAEYRRQLQDVRTYI